MSDAIIASIVAQVNANSVLEQRATRFGILKPGVIPKWTCADFPSMARGQSDLYFYPPEIASHLTFPTLDDAASVINAHELRLLSSAPEGQTTILVTSRGWKIFRAPHDTYFTAQNAFSIVYL